MHNRIIDFAGKKIRLDFGHEGVLYRQSFIMYDKQTGTKWNHSTGLAMAGELTGMRLEILPSWVVRWARWKKMHPNTKVLAREGSGGFMGTYVADRSYTEFGLSVGQGPQAKFYPYDMLSKHEVVNDFVTPHAVVVGFDPAHKESMAFDRKARGRLLTFEPVKARSSGILQMRDRETGSLWERLSGKAIDGKLKGEWIQPLISIPWLKERWRQIYPHGIVYRGLPSVHRR